MSTKAIHEALDRLRDALMDDGAPPDGEEMGCLLAARAELEAIEKAARTLEAEGVGDEVYYVRERAASDGSFEGNTWEHPCVIAYGEACETIRRIAEESRP